MQDLDADLGHPEGQGHPAGLDQSLPERVLYPQEGLVPNHREGHRLLKGLRKVHHENPAQGLLGPDLDRLF